MFEPLANPVAAETWSLMRKGPATTYTRRPDGSLTCTPLSPDYTSWTFPNVRPRIAAERAAAYDLRLWQASRNADEYKARRAAAREKWRRERQAWLDASPTFHSFASLPLEIRLQVWEQAALDADPTDVVLRDPPRGDPRSRILSFRANANVPQLLLVSREAYRATRSFFARAFKDRFDGGVLTRYPTVLTVNPDDLPVETILNFIHTADVEYISELVIEVGGSYFNVYGLQGTKLHALFSQARRLHKFTIKAPVKPIMCPPLDLLHAFWLFRYWSLELKQDEPAWVEPEFEIVYRPGLHEDDALETLLVHCDRGLLGRAGVRWNTTPGLRLQSDYSDDELSEILDPVLESLPIQGPRGVGWWG